MWMAFLVMLSATCVPPIHAHGNAVLATIVAENDSMSPASAPLLRPAPDTEPEQSVPAVEAHQIDPATEPDQGVAAADLRIRNAAIIASGALLVGYYGLEQWWQDGFTNQFRTVKEGWFGQGTEQGGADKLGHSYFSYATARLMARGFEIAGNAPAQARKLGAWSALGVMMGVEILDGYSKKYRFSGEDAMMNLAGVGLAYAMERYAALDQAIDYRLLYRPSPGSGFDPGGDYSGQTYLLILKASALPAWREHSVMRYLEFAIGYGARGYGETPIGDPHRNAYVGLSLNVAEVLGRTVFKKSGTGSGAKRATGLFLELVQVPGTVVLKGHRLRD